MILYISLFLVSFLSGLIVYFKIEGVKKYIKVLLSFSGAYLLGICFLHLIPELFETEGESLGLYLLIGFFLQLLLDYFSGGIEHGHTHVNHKNLGKFPFLVFISLGLHAFLETFPLKELNSEVTSYSYLAGLLIHKIPIAIILVGLLINYKISKTAVFFGLLLFSLMGPAGVWVGSYFESNTIIFQQFLAISIGIILHLSTTILLESNEEHKISLKKLVPLIVGVFFALISTFIH